MQFETKSTIAWVGITVCTLIRSANNLWYTVVWTPYNYIETMQTVDGGTSGSICVKCSAFDALFRAGSKIISMCLGIHCTFVCTLRAGI